MQSNTKHVILVLDNDPPRHAVFRAAAPEFLVLQTYDVSTFAEALKEAEALALICLDHDLQSGVNADRGCEDCGCDAAEIVARQGPACVPVLIHSGNDLCAPIMRRILLASGRIGKVSRVNIATIMTAGDRAGVEMMGQAIQELIASPHWPEGVAVDELMEMLDDGRALICPVRATRR